METHQNENQETEHTNHQVESLPLDQNTEPQEPNTHKENKETTFNKQESLDLYLELKYEPSQKESEPDTADYPNIEKEENKLSNKHLSTLILVEDEEIPSLNLQPSPKSHQPLIVEISSYRTTTFMKISTQIFIIKINNPNTNTNYEIERRFSDFLDLYEQIFYNHPGYITFTFPDKTIDSFVKLKMGLMGEDSEKYEIIEKRMGELERFLKWVVHHDEISNSEELLTFILQDEKKYEAGKTRLNEYVEEYKELERNSKIKSIIEVSKSVFGFFQKKSEESSPRLNEVSFYKDSKKARISELVEKEKEKMTKLIENFKSLLSAEKYFSQFNGMETDIDILLKVCAKHSSGKEFCKKFSVFIEVNAFDALKQLLREMEEVEKSLIHFLDIFSGIEEAKKELNLEKKGKLERRLERAERNFEHDWLPFYENYQNRVKEIEESVFRSWKLFKEQMKKIWKIQN